MKTCGVGTVATPTLMTDYMSRLLRCLDFIKKAVAMNDDVFDFFYEALPGYEEVGRRRILLGCWGAFQDPAVCDYDYKNMSDWGRAMFVTPGIVVWFHGCRRSTEFPSGSFGTNVSSFTQSS